MIFRSLGSGNWKQVTAPAFAYKAVNRAGDTMTGGLTVPAFKASGGATLVAQTGGGGTITFRDSTDAVVRYYISVNDTAIAINTCDNSGNFLFQALSIDRASGVITFPQRIASGGQVWGTGRTMALAGATTPFPSGVAATGIEMSTGGTG